MPGNKKNVRRFNLIDVHIATLPEDREDLLALIPENYKAKLGADFKRAGLLAPDGFTQTRDESNTTINAYGKDGIVESIDTFNFESWAAIFLEDNDVINDLVYPNSKTTPSGTVVPSPVYEQVLTCFTLENTATGYGERWFTIGGSIWRVNGDRTTPDSDIRRTPLIATVMPLDEDESGDAAYPDGGLYVKQSSKDPEAGSEG